VLSKVPVPLPVVVESDVAPAVVTGSVPTVDAFAAPAAPRSDAAAAAKIVFVGFIISISPSLF